MKIAIMVTTWFKMPAPHNIIFAPMELAISIGTSLKKKGHDVTFYAAQGTVIPGMKVRTFNLPPTRRYTGDRQLFEKLANPDDPDHYTGNDERIQIYWDQYLAAKMYEAAERGEHDLIHCHVSNVAVLPLAYAHPNIPTVYTLHDPLYPWRAQAYRMFATTKNQYIVSISDAQRKPAPDLRYAATIYNGIHLDTFPYSEKGGDSFIWVGRVIKEKNPMGAIEIARKAGVKLKLFGQIFDKNFWEKEVKPLLGDGITYEGHIARKDLARHYRQAKGFLFPLIWEEPFGLVVAEAMACGTPVIAFRRGSMPELIKDGKTGFIVDTPAQMVKAIQKIDTIKRSDCRAYVEKHFTTEKMVDEYERLFKKILRVK